MPDYTAYKDDVAVNKETRRHALDYVYYSVIQSVSRRVPIVSASNIYRQKYERVGRAGSFKKDGRIAGDAQLTTQDYSLFNSIKAATIEKGHMTKREDVQWDKKGDKGLALEAAKSTFYYPNAAPQHDALNNGPWKHLENSVIIKGRVPAPAKVSVFTGPVLDALDPAFKARLKDGTVFQIPVLFWKVIYYLKEDGKLYRAGFLMGQINPLRRDGLIDEVRVRGEEKKRPQSSLRPFLAFKEDENYQVAVSLIEALTRLTFEAAIDRHADTAPTVLTLAAVKIKGAGDGLQPQPPTYAVSGLLV